MKIVIDLNVIISAFSSRGLCNDLFELCLYEHDIYLSEYIIKECKNKFEKKIKLSDGIIKNIINYLKNDIKLVVPANINDNICRDKNDIPIIGTAIASRANIIISGDKDLLVLKKYKNIKILSPREFWDFLRKKKCSL